MTETTQKRALPLPAMPFLLTVVGRNIDQTECLKTIFL